MEGWNWTAFWITAVCLAILTLLGHYAQEQRQHILVGFGHLVWTYFLVPVAKLLWLPIVTLLKLLRWLLKAIWSLLIHMFWYHWEFFIGAGITTSALVTTCVYGTWSWDVGLFPTLICFGVDFASFIIMLLQLRCHWKQCQLGGWQRLKDNGEMLDMKGPQENWCYRAIQLAFAAIFFDAVTIAVLEGVNKGIIIGLSLDISSLLWCWFLLFWSEYMRPRFENWGWVKIRPWL